MNEKNVSDRQKIARRANQLKKALGELCALVPAEHITCAKCLGKAHYLGPRVLEEHTEEGVHPVLVSDLSICLTEGCGQSAAATKGRELWHGKLRVFPAAYVAPQAANNF